MLQTASKLYMVVNNAPPQFLPHPPDSIETITIILTHNFFDRLTMNWVSTAFANVTCESHTPYSQMADAREKTGA